MDDEERQGCMMAAKITAFRKTAGYKLCTGEHNLCADNSPSGITGGETDPG